MGQGTSCPNFSSLFHSFVLPWRDKFRNLSNFMIFKINFSHGRDAERNEASLVGFLTFVLAPYKYSSRLSGLIRDRKSTEHKRNVRSFFFFFTQWYICVRHTWTHRSHVYLVLRFCNITRGFTAAFGCNQNYVFVEREVNFYGAPRDVSSSHFFLYTRLSLLGQENLGRFFRFSLLVQL